MSLKFKMVIECGNDAFCNDTKGEVARMLRAEADRLDSEGGHLRAVKKGEERFATKLRDVNGNTVGCAKFVKE